MLYTKKGLKYSPNIYLHSVLANLIQCLLTSSFRNWRTNSANIALTRIHKALLFHIGLFVTPTNTYILPSLTYLRAIYARLHKRHCRQVFSESLDTSEFVLPLCLTIGVKPSQNDIYFWREIPLPRSSSVTAIISHILDQNISFLE